jgi:hypothetical protein
MPGANGRPAECRAATADPGHRVHGILSSLLRCRLRLIRRTHAPPSRSRASPFPLTTFLCGPQESPAPTPRAAAAGMSQWPQSPIDGRQTLLPGLPLTSTPAGSLRAGVLEHPTGTVTRPSPQEPINTHATAAAHMSLNDADQPGHGPVLTRTNRRRRRIWFAITMPSTPQRSCRNSMTEVTGHGRRRRPAADLGAPILRVLRREIDVANSAREERADDRLAGSASGSRMRGRNVSTLRPQLSCAHSAPRLARTTNHSVFSYGIVPVHTLAPARRHAVLAEQPASACPR